MLCTPRHRLLYRIGFLVLATSVVISGFGWSISNHHRPWRIWPWGSWAMFVWENDYLTRLQVIGTKEDGGKIDVDLRRWFRYPVAFEQRRYSKVGLYPRLTRAFADYICDRSNHIAPPGQRLTHVTVLDYQWPREAGRRRRLEEVPETARTVQVYLEHPCPAPDGASP